MAAGANNLQHALANDCTDPDCEIHVPTCIEGESQRLTAMSWFLAGAQLVANPSPSQTLIQLRAIAHDLLEERPL